MLTNIHTFLRSYGKKGIYVWLSHIPGKAQVLMVACVMDDWCNKKSLLFTYNFQVLAALGQDYFDHILPDIIRNCSHQKASVRDGHLTLFRVISPKLSSVNMTIYMPATQYVIDGWYINFIVFAKVFGRCFPELLAGCSSCYIRW